MERNSGFTLAELLIVIAIVAVLSIIALTNYKTQIAKGFDKKRKDHLSRLRIAFEEYYNDHNCYPPSTILDSCGEGATQLTPYLRIVPCDPQTNQSYVLVTESNDCPQWFKIYTRLQNQADPKIEEIGCQNGCGPDNDDDGIGDYNFGISSTNVMVGSVAASSPTPSPAFCSEYYGCFGGVCKLIGPTPDCAPNYCESNCQGLCGDPENPQNECT